MGSGRTGYTITRQPLRNWIRQLLSLSGLVTRFQTIPGTPTTPHFTRRNQITPIIADANLFKTVKQKACGLLINNAQPVKEPQ